MAKYDLKDKLEMVAQYLNGIVSTTISKKYGVKGSATVLGWVKSYEHYGIDGLRRSHEKSIYTTQDKLNILNWMKMNRSSYPETARHFDIKSPSSIWCWKHKLESYGIDGLITRRDRVKMTKSNNNQLNDKDKELAKLKEENLMLKIENDFLKKLKALDDGENHK